MSKIDMRFICEYINARILLSIDGCLVDRGLSFCLFSFGHCIVCPSTIYGFWLPLWYLQTFLTLYICFHLSLSLSPIVFYSSFFFLCLLPCLFWIISWLYTLFYLHHYYYYFHHSMFSLRLLRRRSLSRGGWVSINQFNSTTCLCISKARIRIPNAMRGGGMCGNFFRWMVVVRFANIGGIVDHYCLNFSFIL